MADAQAGQSQQQQRRPPPRHAPSYSSGSISGGGSRNEQSADSAELTQASPPKSTRPSQLRRKSTDKVHSATTARPKGQKHVVGGGASTARLHARVPSSKALHKLHAPSAKLQEQTLLQLQQLQQQQQQQQQRQRRRFSPSPPAADFSDRFPFAAAPPADEPSHGKHQHRHSTSSTDTKQLLRSLENSLSTSSLVRRNASASNLKRNRSHADVSKRMSHPPTRPHTNLKRATTNGSDKLRQASTTAAKKPAGQVRFDIGSVDAQEDEWVDAGPATASGSQTSSFRHEETEVAETEAKTRPQPPTAQTQQPQLTHIDLPIRSAYPAPAHGRNKIASPPPPPLMPSQPDTDDDAPGEMQQPSSSPPMSPSILRSASTTKLLPRTPPRGAPPKISHEKAIASGNATHVVTSSPDSSPTRQMMHKPSVTGASSDRDAMTSRFITSGSHGSGSAGATTGESYYTASSSRSNPGRREGTTPSSRMSISAGTMAMSPYQRTKGEGADTSFLTDDEETGVFIGRIHPRRTGEGAPPAERSRTQQKLNLERASSSIDRSSHQHQGPAAGPLLGGGENGMQDPRIGKLMEKTGMGYYVVRRYQNPVTRSLSRLTDRLGGDRNWRVPAVGMSRTTTNLSGDTAADSPVGGATRPGSRDSTAGHRGVNAAAAAPVPTSAGGPAAAMTPGLSQSFRERDIRRDVLQSATVAMANAAGLTAGVVPHSQARAVATVDGTANAAGEPCTHYEQQQRLGSTSPEDGHGQDSTSSLLRMLWEKNLYLGTSQD